MLVYDKNYIKAKVKKFNGMIKANLLDNEIPKENVHYTCIARITIDSFMKMEKKNYFIQKNASLFRRMQIQNLENKGDYIHKH